MKNSIFKLVIGLVLTVNTLTVFAAEVSSPDGGTPPISTPPDAPGRLDFGAIKSLFSGTLPKVKSADGRYGRASGCNSVRSNWSCACDWQAFRSLPVHVKAIRPTIGQFEANAAKIGLSKTKLKRAMATFLSNQSQLPNQKYLTIIDFDKAASGKRMYIVNLQDGSIKSYKVAHGAGSGGIGAVADHFSNENGTHASSLGCAVATFSKKPNGSTLLKGDGKPKLMMHGLEASNSKMCSRAVFFHPAKYVAGGGRSHGCQAIRPEDKNEIYGKIDGGSLVCAYHDGKIKSGTLRVSRRAVHGRHKRPAARRRSWWN